jgi:hypothetical protein
VSRREIRETSFPELRLINSRKSAYLIPVERYKSESGEEK